MQSDIEYKMPLVNAQGKNETEQLVLSIPTSHQLQDTAPGVMYQGFLESEGIKQAKEPLLS